MSRSLKFSRYVFAFQLADGTHVLSDLLWRTFLELSSDEALVWTGAGGSKSDPNVFPESFQRRLAEQKLVLDSEFDESQFIARRYNDSRFSPNVLGLTIAPTIDCNFACGYCYEAKVPGMMTPEVQSQVIQYVTRNLPGRRRLAVTWYGGEPLLCKETVFHLSKRFLAICSTHDANYSAFLITNGSLLRRSVVDELAELGHWRNVQVTIDGDGAAHDAKRPAKGGGRTFELVLRNLAYAAQHLPMLLRMNVDLINPASCHALLDRLATMGLAPNLQVYFSPIHPFGKGCRDIQEHDDIAVATNTQFADIEMNLLRHASKLGFKTRNVFGAPWLQQCQAVSSHSIVVEPDGSLQRCWIEVGEADKRVGHISQEIELTSENNMRWLRFDPTRNAPCQSCGILPLCFGSCPYRHLDGAPMEYRCKEMRFGVKDRILFEYLAKHRPDQLAAELCPVPPAQRRIIAIVPENYHRAAQN